MLQVIDCHYYGQDHEWSYELTEEGAEFDGWGRGQMKYRRCIRCGVVEYLEFKDGKTGTRTDIRAMLGETWDQEPYFEGTAPQTTEEERRTSWAEIHDQWLVSIGKGEFKPIKVEHTPVEPAYINSSDANLTKDNRCRICGMLWYTCLCSHDD